MLGVILAAAVAVSHGWALADGMFLDDHWHRLRFENDPWTMGSLLDSTTIEPARFVDMWWQDKTARWQYARPGAVVIAKAVYRFCPSPVVTLHALSIGLHLIGALLVHHLCLRMTGRRGWSIVGALIFVFYSHSVYAVGWLAAQNSVLQTVLTLGALAAYARASGLDLDAGRKEDRGTERRRDSGTEGQRDRETAQRAGTVSTPASRRPSIPPSLRPSVLQRGWFAAAIALWAAAMLCRESAVILPVFAGAFDVAFGGWRHARARWGPYLVFAGLGGAYLLWRFAYFHHPIPDYYVRRYDGPGYVVWWLAKLLHYVTAVVWQSPLTVGPTGRMDPLAEVPGDLVLMLGIVGIMGAGYVLATRGARGWWIWPTWIVLSVLPVVPLMAAPHSGYMPGAGFAIAMVLGAGLHGRVRPVWIGRWSRPVAAAFLIATMSYLPVYRTMWYSMLAAERYTAVHVAASPPPSEATDLFFINLPFVNVYAEAHFDELLPAAEGGATRRVHVLTYAPDLLRMDRACRIAQLDAHRFSVSVEGRGYFSGTLGRLLIEAFRDGGRFEAEDTVRGELFDVTVARVDEEGVRELVFRFHEPLSSPRYAFYAVTEACGAGRLAFAGPANESRGQVSVQSRSVDAAAPAEQVFPVEPRVICVESPELGAAAGLEVPGWGAHGRTLGDVTKHGTGLDRQAIERELDTLRWTRDRVYRIREIAGRIIRSDLYLTGPSFPGPR